MIISVLSLFVSPPFQCFSHVKLCKRFRANHILIPCKIKKFHGTMWPTLKCASFVLWENNTTTFSCNSSSFQLTIQLNDAGAYLFSETATDFTVTTSHPIRLNSSISLSLDRIGYGEGCSTLSLSKNSLFTNVTLPLPLSPEFQGASVNITCKKSPMP
jgi:hypothetical protein